MSRELFSEYLKEDYQVFQYKDGVEALGGIKRIPVDIILSDISMPNMDGFCLKQALTQLPHLDSIPFLCSTSTDEFETQNDAAQLGIDDYLIKPIRLPLG